MQKNDLVGRLSAFCRKNTLQKPQKHPPTLTVTSGPQPRFRSNDTKLFCLHCAPTISLWLADALVLQRKAKQVWKETMSLTLEDFVFSSSLSHQWIYEPGEEFPETRCHIIFPQNVTLEEREKKGGEYPQSSELGTFSQTPTLPKICWLESSRPKSRRSVFRGAVLQVS